MGDLVDLKAFREQKEKEAEEKARIEKEEEELEKIEYMQSMLGSIIQQLGDPRKTGSLFYVPMSDDDYFNYYTFESGYNDDGYYESTWALDGLQDPEDDEEL